MNHLFAAVAAGPDDLFDVRQGTNVGQRTDGRRDQPGESEQGAKADQYADQCQVPVIRFALDQLVLWAVDQAGRDVLGKEDQHGRQNRRPDRRDANPHRHGGQVNQPVAT